MEIEHQVASLEYCEELKKLGLKQDAYFSWDYTPNKPSIFPTSVLKQKLLKYPNKITSAFSATELLIKLPTVYFYDKKDYHLSVRRDLLENYWFVEYRCDPNNPVPVYDHTLANASARMLIALISLGITIGDDICPNYSKEIKI